MRWSLILLCSLLFLGSFAQSDTIQEPIEKGIWLEPVQPEFPGGKEKLSSFIKLVQNYPDSSLKKGIEGKVFIKFEININGQLSDFKTFKTPDSLLSDEAIRIVKLMPKWNPGLNYNGDTVKVRYYMPFIFKLDTTPIFKFVQTQPKFSGGQEKLFEYLGKNIKYTDSMFQNGIKSKLYFEFVVEKDGSLSNLKMIRGYNEEFFKHIILVFNNMPKWEPGKINGKPVRTKMVLPINISWR